MYRDVYSARFKLNGEEHDTTLVAATNYAASLNQLRRFEEAKALMRKTVLMARRGDRKETKIRMRMSYARALYENTRATLDDLREAVTTLEEIEPTARRVLGGTHLFTTSIEAGLQNVRAALAAGETPSPDVSPGSA